MSAPFYSFVTFDQSDLNWLTRITDKDGSGYGARFEFLHAFCGRCGQFDHDMVFEKGFENTLARIRVRKGRNILKTDDHFLCVSNDVLKTLIKAGVKGFESKPLYTGIYWHVLRITNRRRFDPSVYRTDAAPCSVCGRIGQYGSAQFEREIDLPKEELTFFSTDKPRGQGGFDYFMTGKMKDLLLEAGVKGGELHRLLTTEEEKQRSENPKWKPKDALVSLGQHRETITD